MIKKNSLILGFTLAAQSLCAVGIPASMAFAANVDNSAMNQPAQTHDQLNAQHQGGSPTDMALTQKIRQDIMKMKNASTYAKNVKIITTNGNVTLKGPVKTDDEKTQIEQIARNAVGAGSVTNQIDIKK